MELSNIAIGQMFIQFPQPIAELQETPKPRVWVKVANKKLGNFNGEDTEEVSVFVDNDTLVGISIGVVREIGLMDKWSITDSYYGRMVREGKFVPINDLRQVESICLELGCELPESKYL